MRDRSHISKPVFSHVLFSYSAYCGGLWLASLCVMCEMAKVMGKEEAYQNYKDILERGSAAFDRLLWNGELKHTSAVFVV